MITTNTDKKALVEKLYKEDKITLDDMLMLLEKPAPVIIRDLTPMPYVVPQPVYPQPYYPYHEPGYWYYGTLTGKMEWMPYSGTISTGSLTAATGTCVPSNACISPDGTVFLTTAQALAFPGTGVSYTSN